MKFCTQVCLILFSLFIGLLYSQYHRLTAPKPLPKLDIGAYWGPGPANKYTENPEIILQEIRYKDDLDEPIQKLSSKLNQSLFLHPPLEGTTFEYGVNTKSFLKVIKYWRDDYLPRWDERESILNRFPHYMTQIQGLNIHFIHTKATKVSSDKKNKRIIPVLLLHGWPGSVREFYDIIPQLALPDNVLTNTVFEVVAPSLPGYGWSQAPSKTGFGIVEMSIVLRNLMIRLGYDRFYVQGGDWGAALGSAISTIFPENVIGYHSNFCFANSPLAHIKSVISSFYPSAFVEEEHQHFYFPRSEKMIYMIAESGYMHIQATKPDTIGTVLTGNPVGLAAYILEKFSTWTNPNNRQLVDGGWSDFSSEFKDAILDDIMIYYLTNSITTSQRLYSEAFTFQQQAYELDRVPTNVPLGCARFPHDLMHSLDWQLKEKFTNIVHSTHQKVGGHFAAMEQPDLLFKDFVEFVKKVEK